MNKSRPNAVLHPIHPSTPGPFRAICLHSPSTITLGGSLSLETINPQAKRRGHVAKSVSFAFISTYFVRLPPRPQTMYFPPHFSSSLTYLELIPSSHPFTNDRHPSSSIHPHIQHQSETTLLPPSISASKMHSSTTPSYPPSPPTPPSILADGVTESARFYRTFLISVAHPSIPSPLLPTGTVVLTFSIPLVSCMNS